MDECFEVGVAHGPLCRREVFLVVEDRKGAVDGSLSICAFAEDKKDLLMDPRSIRD